MRIGIDARFYGPDSKGIGRYTQKLIIHLERIDHENEYIIFLRKNNYDLYVPQQKNFTKAIADYQWYSFGEQFFFPYILYKYHCDLIHFAHFNVPIFYWKKFIVTIHDLILLHYPTRKASTRNALFYWIKFAMYRLVIYMAVKKAIKIIAVSRFTKKDICERYPSVCAKTIVIYEAAEIKENAVMHDESFFVSYGIMKPYMLYVGNAYPHKNLYALIDAFAQYIKNGGKVTGLVLVGKKDYFYAGIIQYIKKNQIENIVILDTVDDQQLQMLYQSAHLFVFPSLYEGFGLPPLEAQLYHIPVLSSDHSCMREILSHDGAVYVDTLNTAVFASAMHEIACNTHKRKKLIAVGYSNAIKYSWEIMAEQTYNIYKNLANGWRSKKK